MEKMIQGDVCLIEVDRNSIDLTKGMKDENRILAYGEKSGHAHVLTEKTELIRIDGKMYVITPNFDSEEVREPLELRHTHLPTKRPADHAPIKLKEGKVYEVRIQNQFNPFSKLMEQVID